MAAFGAHLGTSSASSPRVLAHFIATAWQCEPEFSVRVVGSIGRAVACTIKHVIVRKPETARRAMFYAIVLVQIITCA